jgi:hypothetical protein
MNLVLVECAAFYCPPVVVVKEQMPATLQQRLVAPSACRKVVVCRSRVNYLWCYYANVDQLIFTDLGLAVDTVYGYQVRVVDLAENQSAFNLVVWLV